MFISFYILDILKIFDILFILSQHYYVKNLGHVDNVSKENYVNFNNLRIY